MTKPSPISPLDVGGSLCLDFQLPLPSYGLALQQCLFSSFHNFPPFFTILSPNCHHFHAWKWQNPYFWPKISLFCSNFGKFHHFCLSFIDLFHLIMFLLAFVFRGRFKVYQWRYIRFDVFSLMSSSLPSLHCVPNVEKSQSQIISTSHIWKNEYCSKEIRFQAVRGKFCLAKFILLSYCFVDMKVVDSTKMDLNCNFHGTKNPIINLSSDILKPIFDIMCHIICTSM